MLIPHVTLLFVGILAVIQIPLTVIVGLRRSQTGIQFFDGGDQILLRRMRAHANFTETVPITLLSMAGAEMTGAANWTLWAGGSSLLVGRVVHAAIILAKGSGPLRAVGMLLTLAPMLGFGLWVALHALRGAA